MLGLCGEPKDAYGPVHNGEVGFSTGLHWLDVPILATVRRFVGLVAFVHQQVDRLNKTKSSQNEELVSGA